MSTNRTQSNTGYTCLRIPAFLLAGVGVWGIASEKLMIVSKISASFKLPPIGCCYVIIGGAAILYGISLMSGRIYRKTNTKTSTPRDGWRNC